MNQKYVLDVLNDIRIKLNGLVLTQLPSGVRNDGKNCVIANALKDLDPGVRVYKEGIFSNNRKFAEIVAQQLHYSHELITWDQSIDYLFGVPTPVEMRNFIEEFDNGSFPELEKV